MTTRSRTKKSQGVHDTPLTWRKGEDEKGIVRNHPENSERLTFLSSTGN